MSSHAPSPFDLVIAVDWSAAAVPGPRRPSEDRCWAAWAWADEPAPRRPPPEYFRTRAACIAWLADLLESHPGARTLVGFDFPFGYPCAPGPTPALPTGRALGALMAELLEDRDDDSNNRFEVAAELNRRVRAATGAAAGPFWGHPAGRDYADLTPTRPTAPLGIAEYRRCDLLVRGSLKRQIQSPWKLAYPASVGSQIITGLAAVHRLMGRSPLQARSVLWPFEPWNQPDAAPPPAGPPVVISEIWPGLIPFDHIRHPIKDARQVLATRDAMMEMGARGLHVPAPEAPFVRSEGWIVGLGRALSSHAGRGADQDQVGGNEHSDFVRTEIENA